MHQSFLEKKKKEQMGKEMDWKYQGCTCTDIEKKKENSVRYTLEPNTMQIEEVTKETLVTIYILKIH